MKKALFALSVLSIAFSLVACSNGQQPKSEEAFNFEPDFSYITDADVSGKTLNVGAILIGDETEGYSQSHIDGINKAKAELEKHGAKVNVTYKKKVDDSKVNEVVGHLETLTADGNNVIITNSYGHQNAFGTEASQFDFTKHTDVDYISMTGDTAVLKKAANFHNAFNNIYEARFVSGYIAGLKLKECIEKGELKANNYSGDNIKLGYVGAHPYAEVVSGYTAFYLGVKEVVSNIVMDVKYVGSWWDHDAENTAAKTLIDAGAFIVSQHADSTGTPEACETANNEGKKCYNVGYNVSMIDAAPNTSLVSSTNYWAVYYTHAFFNKITGKAIERDWSAGFDQGAVRLTNINYGCFNEDKASISGKVANLTKQLRNDEIEVFDTQRWTVKGQHLDSYVITDGWSTVAGTECIKAKGTAKYFDESNPEVRSAPYFDVRVDGITELND